VDRFNDRPPQKKKTGAYVSLFFLVFLSLSSTRVFPDVENTDESKTKNPEIHVTSDYLVSDRNANYAEFQGNVVATQEGSVLTSERLKITYGKEPSPGVAEEKKEDRSPVGAIETIVATGNVKMVMEDKTAWADMATFNRLDNTIILTGGNPRVVSGKSTVSGEKIILNRTTGQVSVHRGKGHRVEAFFYPDDIEKTDTPKKNNTVKSR